MKAGVDVGCQTNTMSDDVICKLHERIQYLEKLVLTQQTKMTKGVNNKSEGIQSSVKSFLEDKGYNKSLIKKILNPGARPKQYTNDDICFALVLRSISSKAFKFI